MITYLPNPRATFLLGARTKKPLKLGLRKLRNIISNLASCSIPKPSFPPILDFHMLANKKQGIKRRLCLCKFTNRA